MANEAGCGCGCDQEIILITGGTGGPTGPPGPQGPPGPGASFPIAATNISVTNPGFANLQEILNYLLYTPIAITIAAQVNRYLIGSSVSTLTFNWTINKTVLTKTISGTNLPVLAITFSPTIATLSGALNPGAVNTVYTYTLTANDGVNTVTNTTNVGFYNNLYYGDSVIPGAVDSAFVTGLTSSIQPGKAVTVIANPVGLTTYAWFACRLALGNVTFTVGGFAGGFDLVTTPGVGISVTNSSGFTEFYNVYRSTNPGLGAFNYVTS